MKKIWCLVVVLAVFIASDAMAARVFLRDGSVVQCQSFWRNKDTVYVKVNRDVLLEFSVGEVNAKKTFRARPVKKAKPVVRSEEQMDATDSAPAASPADGMAKPAPLAGQAPSTSAAKAPSKPGSTPPPAGSTGTTTATPASKQAPASGAVSAPAPATPAAQATPVPDKVVPAQPVPVPAAPIPSAVAEAAGMGFSLTFLLVPLLLAIIIIASMWKVFEKAGEAGWKAIIPIYNLYVLVSIAGKPGWWFIVILLVPLIGFIFYLLVCLALAQKFNKSPLYGVLLCFFGFIMFPLLAFDDSIYSG